MNLFCKLFGHKYRPRYDESLPDNLLKARFASEGELNALRNKTYRGDICERCGLTALVKSGTVSVEDARQSSAQAQDKQLALEAAARSAEERRGREQEKRLGPCVNYPACGCKVQHGYDCIPF